MFTGIIEKIGTFQSKRNHAHGEEFTFGCVSLWQDLAQGESIAVNGVCLTVTSFSQTAFCADVSLPTLTHTTLGTLKANIPVHLERAMQATGRFGGHFVQGHVDGIGTVRRTYEREGNLFLQIEIPDVIMKHLVVKGSIAIDGVSLTVQTLGANACSVVIVPFTRSHTRFAGLRHGDVVNVEVDVLSKYVAHHLSGVKSSALTADYLKKQGF